MKEYIFSDYNTIPRSPNSKYMVVKLNDSTTLSHFITNKKRRNKFLIKSLKAAAERM